MAGMGLLEPEPFFGRFVILTCIHEETRVGQTRFHVFGVAEEVILVGFLDRIQTVANAHRQRIVLERFFLIELLMLPNPDIGLSLRLVIHVDDALQSRVQLQSRRGWCGSAYGRSAGTPSAGPLS